MTYLNLGKSVLIVDNILHVTLNTNDEERGPYLKVVYLNGTFQIYQQRHETEEFERIVSFFGLEV